MKIDRKFIAKKLGLSEAAVSYAFCPEKSKKLSEKTKKRILSLAKKFSYKPNSIARRLSSGRTNNIGIISRAELSYILSEPFLNKIFIGIESECEKIEHTLSFALLKEQNTINPSVMNLISSGLCDGIITIGMIPDKIVKVLRSSSIKFVMIDYYPMRMNVNSVLPENRKAAYEATRYLYESGCKKIFCINGKLKAFHPSYSERPAGYLDACNDLGIKGKIIYSPPSFYDAKCYLKSKLKKIYLPDGFVICGGQMAYACEHVLKKMSQSRIRLITFDDITMKGFENFSFSTIKIDQSEMGRKAVRLLLKKIESKLDDTEIVRQSFELKLRKI